MLYQLICVIFTTASLELSLSISGFFHFSLTPLLARHFLSAISSSRPHFSAGQPLFTHMPHASRQGAIRWPGELGAANTPRRRISGDDDRPAKSRLLMPRFPRRCRRPHGCAPTRLRAHELERQAASARRRGRAHAVVAIAARCAAADSHILFTGGDAATLRRRCRL